MVDFGDEIVLQSYRVSWLIWIQIIVLILLLFVIYCFTIFTSSDLCVDDEDVLASSCSSQLGKGKKNAAVLNCLRASESQGVKAESVSSTRRRIVNEDDTSESAGLLTKDITPTYSHPCHIIRLARVVFLKCLGLEPDQSSSSSKQRES